MIIEMYIANDVDLKIWGPVGKVQNLVCIVFIFLSIKFLKMLKFETWGKLFANKCNFLEHMR